MSEAMSLDRFDEVNAFRIELNGADTDQDAIEDALADRDEWECNIDADAIHVKGAGTEDGLRNLLQALTDIDPDAITIHDDEEADDESDAVEADGEDTDDEVDSDEAADETADEAPEDANDTDVDDAESADDPEEDAVETDDEADEAPDSDEDADTDQGTDDATDEADEPATGPSADADDTPGTEAAAGSMLERFTGYMEQHSDAVMAADTALDALDLDISSPDELLALLQLPERTAYIVEETGYDEETVNELLDEDADDVETELDEVTATIEQLETLKETSGDRLSSLEPDDIDEELEQLTDEQAELEEQLERLEAVDEAADEYDAKRAQADRLEDALRDTADAIDNRVELAVVEQDDTYTVLLPGTDDGSGALAALTRSRVTQALDSELGADTYTVTAGNPLTMITVGKEDIDLQQLQNTVQDGTAADIPADLTHRMHLYAARTV